MQLREWCQKDEGKRSTPPELSRRGEERGDGLARLSGGADGGEVGSQGAVALFAGRGDGEHARDEGVARVGLGAEAAFTLEHGWPNGALSGVVGRRDAGRGHEGPQGRPVHKEVVAETVDIVDEGCPDRCDELSQYRATGEQPEPGRDRPPD